MTTFEWIRYTADYDVARITLARPPLNILTIPMMEEIAAALALAADHASLKVLVLAGEGRAFCAGVANPADSDADGLGDASEVQDLATLPNQWDSDGDAITDTLEVKGFAYKGQTWYLDAYADGVNAYLDGKSGAEVSLEYAVLAATNGDYEIVDVPSGTWPKVIATAPGYEPESDAVTVAPEGTATFDAQLRRDWAAASGGASIASFTGPDYTDFGCGPGGAIDLSAGSGWGSETTADGAPAASADDTTNASAAARRSSSTWIARSAPRARASRMTCVTRAGPAEHTTTSPPCVSRRRSASSSA